MIDGQGIGAPETFEQEIYVAVIVELANGGVEIVEQEIGELANAWPAIVERENDVLEIDEPANGAEIGEVNDALVI